jgi:hypothetical protein
MKFQRPQILSYFSCYFFGKQKNHAFGQNSFVHSWNAPNYLSNYDRQITNLWRYVFLQITKICIFYLASWKTWFASFFQISEQTKHYILTHFTWFWWIVNNVNFIRDPVMKAAYLCKFKFRIGMLLILKYQHSNLEFRILISRTLSRGLAVPRGISHSANCRFRIARAISNLRAWLTVKSHD